MQYLINIPSCYLLNMHDQQILYHFLWYLRVVVCCYYYQINKEHELCMQD